MNAASVAEPVGTAGLETRGGTAAGSLGGSTGPNLARRPFVNGRPVTRLAVLLWLLGGGLLIANVFSVSAYLVGSAQKRERLAELESEIGTEASRSAVLSGELAGLELEDLNDRVAYLNRRIAERTFTWGRLFDDISEVLPREVRIVGISPLSIAREQQAQARPPKNARTAGADDGNPEFPLEISGVARTSEQLLDFIDALFARPGFAHPDLASEEVSAEGLAFSATAIYRSHRGALDRPDAINATDASSGGAVLEAVPTPEATVAPAGADGAGR